MKLANIKKSKLSTKLLVKLPGLILESNAAKPSLKHCYSHWMPIIPKTKVVFRLILFQT